MILPLSILVDLYFGWNWLQSYRISNYEFLTLFLFLSFNTGGQIPTDSWIRDQYRINRVLHTGRNFCPIWSELGVKYCIQRQFCAWVVSIIEIFSVQLMANCLNSPSNALEYPLLTSLLVLSILYLFDSSACLWWVHVKDISFQIFWNLTCSRASQSRTPKL